NPADQSVRGKSLRKARITFSEPLAAATVSASTFQILDSAGNAVPLINVGLRSGDRVVQLAFNGLDVGDYRIVIKAAQVTDRAGNVLGAGDIVSHFSIALATIKWINPAGGSWTTASNWDRGVVP